MIPLMKNAFLNEHDTKKQLAEFILRADRLSMGSECMKFEEEFSKFQECKKAVLFNSGGSANLALLQAMKNLGKLKDGDAVGFSVLTWSTNVMPIIQLGLKAVPIDCEPTTLNTMSSNLLDRIEQTPIKALFITNALGFAGDLDEIRRICEERDIILLEDNCESLGTRVNGTLTGNFSLASTFSFFVAHHMSTVEGGMICSGDDELVEMLQIVRANGWDRNLRADQQHKWRKQYDIHSEFEAKYTFYDLGFNLRPTEITGFLGQTQLAYLDDNIRIRESNYKRFHEAVIANGELIAFELDHLTVISCFALPILCKSKELREKYMRQFSGAGIEIRPMIAGNIQRQPFYRRYVKDIYDTEGADFVHECGFYCGNYPDLNENDRETILSCLIPYS